MLHCNVIKIHSVVNNQESRTRNRTLLHTGMSKLEPAVLSLIYQHHPSGQPKHHIQIHSFIHGVWSGENTVVIHGVQQSRLQCNPARKGHHKSFGYNGNRNPPLDGGFRDERVGFCFFFLLTRKKRDNLIFTSLVKNDKV